MSLPEQAFKALHNLFDSAKNQRDYHISQVTSSSLLQKREDIEKQKLHNSQLIEANERLLFIGNEAEKLYKKTRGAPIEATVLDKVPQLALDPLAKHDGVEGAGDGDIVDYHRLLYRARKVLKKHVPVFSDEEPAPLPNLFAFGDTMLTGWEVAALYQALVGVCEAGKSKNLFLLRNAAYDETVIEKVKSGAIGEEAFAVMNDVMECVLPSKLTSLEKEKSPNPADEAAEAALMRFERITRRACDEEATLNKLVGVQKKLATFIERSRVGRLNQSWAQQRQKWQLAGKAVMEGEETFLRIDSLEEKLPGIKREVEMLCNMMFPPARGSMIVQKPNSKMVYVKLAGWSLAQMEALYRTLSEFGVTEGLSKAQKENIERTFSTHFQVAQHFLGPLFDAYAPIAMNIREEVFVTRLLQTRVLAAHVHLALQNANWLAPLNESSETLVAYITEHCNKIPEHLQSGYQEYLNALGVTNVEAFSRTDLVKVCHYIKMCLPPTQAIAAPQPVRKERKRKQPEPEPEPQVVGDQPTEEEWEAIKEAEEQQRLAKELESMIQEECDEEEDDEDDADEGCDEYNSDTYLTESDEE